MRPGAGPEAQWVKRVDDLISREILERYKEDSSFFRNLAQLLSDDFLSIVYELRQALGRVPQLLVFSCIGYSLVKLSSQHAVGAYIVVYALNAGWANCWRGAA